MWTIVIGSWPFPFRAGSVACSIKTWPSELAAVTLLLIMAPTLREFMVKVGDGRDET